MSEPGQPDQGSWAGRVVSRRVEKKGLRPRLAAAVIAILWLIAIVIFGIVEHLIDPATFDTIWLGMWWATQTVTTVGYGDVVPVDAAGQLMATVLMIGGLSFFAVVTGAITSAFVARAQATQRASAKDPMMLKLNELETRLTAIQADLARLPGAPGEQRRPPG
ncbi:MAG: voltage-gated potassium channel [Solirubrobacterales bacterium]|jgi:voltage-gated potassium channel|nr:voltage-gated potassium channel [Solirubrobacterales bacterium]